MSHHSAVACGVVWVVGLVGAVEVLAPPATAPAACFLLLALLAAACCASAALLCQPQRRAPLPQLSWPEVRIRIARSGILACALWLLCVGLARCGATHAALADAVATLLLQCSHPVGLTLFAALALLCSPPPRPHDATRADGSLSEASHATGELALLASALLMAWLRRGAISHRRARELGGTRRLFAWYAATAALACSPIAMWELCWSWGLADATFPAHSAAAARGRALWAWLPHYAAVPWPVSWRCALFSLALSGDVGRASGPGRAWTHSGTLDSWTRPSPPATTAMLPSLALDGSYVRLASALLAAAVLEWFRGGHGAVSRSCWAASLGLLMASRAYASGAIPTAAHGRRAASTNGKAGLLPVSTGADGSVVLYPSRRPTAHADVQGAWQGSWAAPAPEDNPQLTRGARGGASGHRSLSAAIQMTLSSRAGVRMLGFLGLNVAFMITEAIIGILS